MEHLEVEGKQRDLENKVRIEQLDDDMRNFCLHVIQDIDYMEKKLIEALQRDTIALIDEEELQPIKKRL